jgi:hypothetical protein
MSEFVDNSLQSFLDNRGALQRLPDQEARLRVEIEIDPIERTRVIIRDNAAGIHAKDYRRAFRPAEVPPDRTGLSEFGMGMKSAACWFARSWAVRTSALGESVERTVSFDIERIVQDDLEDLTVTVRPAPPDAHYTEIILGELHKPMQGRTIGKVKDHLESIYRIFIRQGILDLRFDGESLAYPDPAVLVAPYFKNQGGEPKQWRKEIDLDFGLDLRAHGFAALRATGSTTDAGFALFRRNRLIQGSREEAYRPELIFGKSNSFTYQRLFGELHLEGFDVSHTKDGFQWDQHEDIVLEALKETLNQDPLPLLSEAEGHRTRVRTEDIRSAAEVATERTAEAIQRDAPLVLDHQLASDPGPADPAALLPDVSTASHRVFDIQLKNCRWVIELELSNDPAVGDWVSVSDQPGGITDHDEPTRHLGIRLALAHPFSERFGGTDPSQIEPLLRLAAAIVLAEVIAREGGVKLAGRLRHYINELLRDALSKP